MRANSGCPAASRGRPMNVKGSGKGRVNKASWRALVLMPAVRILLYVSTNLTKAYMFRTLVRALRATHTSVTPFCAYQDQSCVSCKRARIAPHYQTKQPCCMRHAEQTGPGASASHPGRACHTHLRYAALVPTQGVSVHSVSSCADHAAVMRCYTARCYHAFEPRTFM